MFTFECDNGTMLAQMNKLCKLVEKARSRIDYQSKKEPLVSMCEKGKGLTQLNFPIGVTVDNMLGNIYIADSYNNCVKVFYSTGKYF